MKIVKDEIIGEKYNVKGMYVVDLYSMKRKGTGLLQEDIALGIITKVKETLIRRTTTGVVVHCHEKLIDVEIDQVEGWYYEYSCTMGIPSIKFYLKTLQDEKYVRQKAKEYLGK